MQVPLHRSVHWHRQLGTHTKLDALSTILLLANVHAYSSLIYAPWCPPPIHPPICSPSPPCPPLPLCSKACAPPCPWPPATFSPGLSTPFPWSFAFILAPLHHTCSLWPQETCMDPEMCPLLECVPHFSECGSICLYFPTPYRIT